MEISLETVQSLAPDQASLNAAKKLLAATKWPVKQQDKSVNTIWGECQGSGSKPYYVMADVVDHGYKCTCPSRKFPCKHVLAIMWQFSLDANAFYVNEPPQWVEEWLGRRKKTPSSKSEKKPIEEEGQARQGEHKNINLVTELPKTPLSPEEQQKLDLSKAKRAEKVKANTEALINAGVIEFQQWIDDQLRTGIDGFLKEMKSRCRQIAARLVDAKATNLASRVDELPSKLMGLPLHTQVNETIKQLGQLAIISAAWLANSDSDDIKRVVNTSENRDQLLEDDSSLKVQGIWQVIGKRQETRKDGLISQSTWLINASAKQTQLAVLQDYYPSSSGSQNLGMIVGSQIEGELVYYKSALPQRAILGSYKVVSNSNKTPLLCKGVNPNTEILHHLSILPWTEHSPCMLNKGKILTHANNQAWFVSDKDNFAIQLLNPKIPELLLGCELDSAFVLYNGNTADLLFAKSVRWGEISC